MNRPPVLANGLPCWSLKETVMDFKVSKPQLVIACIAVALTIVLGSTIDVGAASAAVPGPHWNLRSLAVPTTFEQGDCLHTPETSEGLEAGACDHFTLVVTNDGGKESEGSIVVTDIVPSGLKPVVNAGGEVYPAGVEEASGQPTRCVATGQEVECVYGELGETISPEGFLKIPITVEVEAGVSGTLPDNVAGVSGGGAESQVVTSPTVVSSPPVFGLVDFNLEPIASDGTIDERAGDHPNVVTGSFAINSRYASLVPPGQRAGEPAPPAGYLKDALSYLPIGLVGNPTVLPRCPLSKIQQSPTACPVGSRVGTVQIAISGSINGSVAQEGAGVISYLYNVAPVDGFPATFAFNVLSSRAVFIPADLVRVGGERGSYALRVGAAGIPKIGFVPATALRLSFWGNPSARNGGQLPQKAFLTNPTDCSGPSEAKIEVDSWENPGVWSEQSTTAYPELRGCEALPFSPGFKMRPQSAKADSPSDYEAVLTIPQGSGTSPSIATATLKDAKVTLPAGVTLSASAANGLTGCPSVGPEGINIGSDEIGHAGQDLGDPEATELGAGHPDGNGSRYDDGLYHTARGRCPASSKIGSVKIKTQLLEEGLTGGIFVARPTCAHCTDADAQDGDLYRIYLEAEAPKAGVIIKLEGRVSADPQTGQLTATFKENPELPFEELRLSFEGDSVAPLANPLTCGTKTTETDFTPWSTPQTPDATPKDSFVVDTGANGGNCVSSEREAPNAPRFEAGSANPLAGAYTPSVLKLHREDGSQRIEKLNLSLPSGLIGKLAGVPYCPDPQIVSADARSGTETLASPPCPSASEVGRVTVGAGPGPRPFNAHGHVYLAGPYEGAPLSLVIVTPAVAGPFDLGTVVVRTALFVNEETAQITAKSDPIPQILDGTPLDVRSITLELDRKQFTLNPTNCEAMNITGSAVSATGMVAPLANRFQVGGCKGLGYHPNLRLQVKGAVKRTGHPAFKAVITFPHRESEANTKRIQVGLPASLFLDQANLNKVCKQAELKAATCPPSSIYGRVKAWTPILEKPLEGPVYLGVGFGYKLPALVTDLDGQVRILAHGRVDTTKQHGLRTTFAVIPDAPISRLVLELKGGKKYGLLQNSESLCRASQHANARFVAQNGAVAQLRPKILSGCKSKHTKVARTKGH
jgi:hypothetical protein